MNGSRLADRAAEELERDGFTLLEGVIDHSLIAELIGGLAAAVFGSEGAADPLIRLRTWKPTHDEIVALRGLADALPALHALSRPPRLVAAMQALLGVSSPDELFVQPRKLLRVAKTTRVVETIPHQDFRYVQGAVDTLSAWIPLHAVGKQQSCLRFLPGSHHGGLLPICAEPVEIDIPMANPRWVEVPCGAGDAVIFHSLTVHAAGPNHTRDNRLSLDVRFQRICEPLSEGGRLATFPTDEAIAADPRVWSRDPGLRLPPAELLVPRVEHPELLLRGASSRFARLLSEEAHRA